MSGNLITFLIGFIIAFLSIYLIIFALGEIFDVDSDTISNQQNETEFAPIFTELDPITVLFSVLFAFLLTSIFGFLVKSKY